MKVAYNNCFGGFGLSALATTEFAKKKGIALTWYKQVGYKHNGNEKHVRISGIPNSNGMGISALISDCGEVITELPDELFYYLNIYDSGWRTDSDLIEVIEKLGDKASGECAKLAIKEIPDGIDFEITEYDGNEDVVPPRPSW